MDYARIKEIAKRHHLEFSYPILMAMKQAAGEAAQEMRCRYLEALHELQLPDEMITDLNRQASRGFRRFSPLLEQREGYHGQRQNTCDNLHDSDLWPDRMA